MRRDYYAVLGVAATAPPREIRQAYRRLARQYSPDVNFWEATARTLFEEIAEAYRILSDPDARSLYDRFGAQPDALAAGRRGEDVHVAVEIGFADVVHGVSVELAVPRFSPCETCHARGHGDGGACGACAGRGVRRTVDRVEVAIPAGVDSGMQIRVPGQGSAGPFGWTSPAASTRAPTSSCASWSGSCRSPRAVTSSASAGGRHDQRPRQAALHDRRRRRDAEGAPPDAAVLRKEGPGAAQPDGGTDTHVLGGGRRGHRAPAAAHA